MSSTTKNLASKTSAKTGAEVSAKARPKSKLHKHTFSFMHVQSADQRVYLIFYCRGQHTNHSDTNSLSSIQKGELSGSCPVRADLWLDGKLIGNNLPIDAGAAHHGFWRIRLGAEASLPWVQGQCVLMQARTPSETQGFQLHSLGCRYITGVWYECPPIAAIA